MEPTLDSTFAKSEKSQNIINEKFKILTNQIYKKIFLRKKKWEGNIQKFRHHGNTIGETFTYCIK